MKQLLVLVLVLLFVRRAGGFEQIDFYELLWPDRGIDAKKPDSDEKASESGFGGG